MIAIWMLYCTAVALLLGLAALALERGLLVRDWPVRGAWIASIAASLILPVVAWFSPRGADMQTSLSAPSGAGSTAVEILPIQSSLASGDARFAWLGQLDSLLLTVWALGMVGVLAGLVVLFVRMHQRRRSWRAASVAGAVVLISRSTGPAVIGFLRPRIVLPEWVLERDEETQRVVVEHEREHIRAGDPYLILLAIAALLAMPWNLALWWQVRRLRLAIELDCDARVLQGQPDVRRYGMLLLDVGHVSASGHPALAAFSEPQSFLERRIRIMTRSRPHTAWPHAIGFAAVGALLVLVACEAPQPGPVATAESAADVSRVEQVAADTTLPGITDATRREIATLLERAYPALLRDAGVEGQAVLDFVVDEQGTPQDIKVVRTTHQQFGAAAVRVMREARFNPARVGERAVAKRLQLPIAFKLASGVDRNADVKRIGPTPMAAAAGDTVFPQITDEYRRQVARMLEQNYPPMLRAAGVEGQAVIDFTVGRDGIPRNVRVERATHEQFGKAAIAVIREARFHPARVGTTPVAKRIQIPIAFKVASQASPGGQ